MFIKVTENDVEYSYKNIENAWSLKDSNSKTNVIRAINQNEKIWFESIDFDFKYKGESYFKHFGYEQLGVLDLLAFTYDVGHREIISAIVNEKLDHDPVQQAYISLRYNAQKFSNVNIDSHRVKLDHVTYAQVLGWLLDNRNVTEQPWTSLFNYDHDAGRHVDTSMPPYDLGLLKTHAWVQARNLVQAFHEHLILACVVALDTPQPITIGTKAERLIVAENTRISPLIAGLRLTLPTGSVMFWRHARIDPQSGELLIRGKRKSPRALAIAVVKQLAEDLLWLRLAATTFGQETPASLVDFMRW